MERRYVKEVDRLRAMSHDGEVFTVVEYQRIFEFVQVNGASTRAKGLRVFRLDNGACVNYVDSETFKIVDTGQIIQKIQDSPSPSACRVPRYDWHLSEAS
jgi:hypothetical protein